MRTMVFVLAALAGGLESAAAGTPIVEPIPNGRVASVQGVDRPPAAASRLRGEPAVLRNNRGVVYHRQQGTNWGTDGYLLP